MSQSNDAPGQATLREFDRPDQTDTGSDSTGRATSNSDSPDQAILHADGWGDSEKSPSTTGSADDWYSPIEKSREDIFQDIIDKFESQPVHQFERPSFAGCGVYALYYHGDLEMYDQISNPPRTQNTPIYVGKAGPGGGRTGVLGDADYDVPKLAERIGEHYESVQEAQNLRTDDFTYTRLKLTKPHIQFAEQALITEYWPWWNSVITGLGNHDPGGNREGTEQSVWDTFHPGRYFVQKRNMTQRGTQESVWRQDVYPELSDAHQYTAIEFPGCKGPPPYNPRDESTHGEAALDSF